METVLCRRTRLVLVVSCAAALAASSCSNSNAPQRVQPSESAPADPHAGAGASTAREPRLRAQGGEYAFTTPAGWVAETPAQFRKLQYSLPRVEGDEDDAQVWVTDFGGGTREQNAERWIGEFEQPDGKSSRDVAKQGSRRVGDVEIFEVDVSGTCLARMAPMAQATMRKEGWRQIAVILEGGPVPWYVKVRGPIATVTKWEASFRAFVDSAKRAK